MAEGAQGREDRRRLQEEGPPLKYMKYRETVYTNINTQSISMTLTYMEYKHIKYIK